jgi:hypothetical protein
MVASPMLLQSHHVFLQILRAEHVAEGCHVFIDPEWKLMSGISRSGEVFLHSHFSFA